MIDIAMLRAKKKARNLTNAQIAALSGVPFSTVNKVLAGETKNPRYKTLLAIQNVLLENGSSPAPDEPKETASLPAAPDWVVEVVSETDSEHDFLAKRIHYGRMGVREYWMIDPQKKKICVYDFKDTSRAKTYAFGEDIPSAVVDGAAVCLKSME